MSFTGPRPPGARNRLPQIERLASLQGVGRLVAALGVAIMLIVVGLLVYVAGGTKYVYAHAMYLPVFAAAFLFRHWGGLVAAVLASVILGPLMPLDTLSGEMQAPQNWLFRSLVFVTVGLGAGYAFGQMGLYIEQFREQSLRDNITDLGNKNDLLWKLEELALDHGSERYGLVVFELNCVDRLSTTLGERYGEQFLIQAARRLIRTLDDGVPCVRLRGDRFAILLKGKDATQQSLETVGAAFQANFTVFDLPVYVTWCAGVAYFPDDATDATGLIHKAVTAMLFAEENGRASAVYEESLERESRESLQMLAELNTALGAGQLYLHYQPILDLRTDGPVAVEALLRWEHPVRGNVPPADFIGAAEATGLIDTITEFVLNEAAAQNKKWAGQGMFLATHVNISARNLMNPGFIPMLKDVLERHDLRPDLLELELTETTVMLDPDHSLEVLRQVAALGVQLAIDDFGTGHSSLSYIQRLPIQKIKIDRSFVCGAELGQRDREIASMAILLARELSLKAVAEGVESKEAMADLRSMGCDLVQGYLICKPLPAAEVTAWLRRNV